MPLHMRQTIQGITISLGEGELTPPERQPDADQNRPRKHYIYAHVDMDGNIFYVGKGKGRRAWSEERHQLWHRYLQHHLGYQYRVEILADNIPTDSEAEDIEAHWIFHLGGQLVNWVNTGRQFDYEKLEIYHQRRNANRNLVARAREIEKSNLASAVDMYKEAIAAIPSYESMRTEGGLIGQLRDEEEQEQGRRGYIEPLDRLTMCLTKLGRSTEALEHAREYFEHFPGDRNRSEVPGIEKRIHKGIKREGGPE